MVAMLFVCFFVCLFGGSQSAVVQPSPCSSSPHNAADSLDAYLAEWALRRSDVMELQLASGEHCVRNFSLVRDLEDRSLVANGSAVIKCAPGVGVAFYNMTNLTLANIVLDGCGLELDLIKDFLSVVAADIDIFLVLSNNSDQYIAMAMGNCRDLVMENTSIMNTMGLGLLAINLVGQSQLTNVRLENNVPPGCFTERTPPEFFKFERIGGAALFIYLDYMVTSGKIQSSLNITNSTISRNSYCGYSTWYALSADYSGGLIQPVLAGGGGLSLIMAQLQYGVIAAIYDSMFMNNTGFYGGGVYAIFFTGVFDSEVTFSGCEFVSNGVEASLPMLEYPVMGSGLAIYIDMALPGLQLANITQSPASTLYVLDCTFTNNTAFTGVVAILSYYNLILHSSGTQIHFERCIFQQNKAVSAPALYAQEYKSSNFQQGIHIFMHDVQILDNEVLSQSRLLLSPSDLSGIIHLKEVRFALSGNSYFLRNEGSALKATSALISLHGDITFCDNMAAYGGGMSLIENTFIFLVNDTNVSFINNTAAVSGGAIYVETNLLAAETPVQDCFLFFGSSFLCAVFAGDYCGDITKMGVTIRFQGNVASLGGMIYGSTLHTCPWTDNFRQKYAPGTQFREKRLFMIMFEENNFTSPLQFDRPPSDVTAVSTNTFYLNATDPEFNSSITHLNVAPGIDETIELAARDAFGQLIPALTSSRSSTPDITPVLGSSYVFIGYNTTEVTSISVTSPSLGLDGGSAEVSLFTIGTYTQLQLNVSFTSCPGGFYYNITNNNCTCLESLREFRITCTSDGGLIVPVTVWVDPQEESTVVVPCSFDFCNNIIKNLNEDMEVTYDEQCQESYNRLGPGCGSCATNYSAVFGSNRCLRCSNIYILLLLVFGVLGILLMAVLLLLRISIAGGFLNGVLFFSNIVSLYAPFFAPTSDLRFLLFSWLSLKFDIEACFFNGMKPLHVAVLNFVFPFYLYLLVLVIVVLTRKSSKLAEFLFRTRSSPSQLFATILVMTYTSLLESCLQAISFTPLHIVNPNGTATEYRWHLDPSVKYFHGGHAALGVLAIILLVFFLIPAPILWMFPASRVRHKYKPIYDAVWAPFKPRYRFWVSLRLLLRIFPILFVSFVQLPENLLFLSFYLVLTLFIHGIIHPFHGYAQNVCDIFLQILLLVMTISSFYFVFFSAYSNLPDSIVLANRYIKQTNRLHHITTIVLLAIAYTTCCIIYVWHLITAFPWLRKKAQLAWNRLVCRRFRVHLSDSYQSKHNAVSIQSEDMSRYGTIEDETTEAPIPRNIATFSELRDSILEMEPMIET